jgi:hypothetical protein|tara:strand:+ start:825 stop:968 length:144 start_codon:yes stop_codon:yes gene_type:complete
MATHGDGRSLHGEGSVPQVRITDLQALPSCRYNANKKRESEEEKDIT